MDIQLELEKKKIAVLGMGREGWSTYEFLRKIFPLKRLTLIDQNNGAFKDKILDENSEIISGDNYLANLSAFDLIFKAPGIPSFLIPQDITPDKISSQTDLFLKLFSKQCVGVTGTKGKSTTSSLIYHIIKESGRNVHFAGNIGIPPLSLYNEIAENDVIVMELSSHQLENISISPHIGIILNLFEEHLDHYHSYREYCLAKLNLGKFQNDGDILIYGSENEMLKSLVREVLPLHKGLLPFSTIDTTGAGIHLEENDVTINDFTGNKTQIANISNLTLPGTHNRGNAMAAAAACFFIGISPEKITQSTGTFKGLPHRIEFAGEFNGIRFYDDSISTIPAATIQAVETLKDVSTLILGGFDRGIDYSPLVSYLLSHPVENLIFTGSAGIRIHKELMISGEYSGKVFFADDFKHLASLCFEHTSKGKICLLSPAAASYDMFKNFEERGDIFKKNVREYLTFFNK